MTVTCVPSLEGRPDTLFADLSRFGEQLAVATRHFDLSYSELAERVATRGAELGPGRRLVLLAGENHIESLVTYLAALSAGHAVVVVPGDQSRHLDSLVAAYDPDVVCSGAADQWRPQHRRAGSAHDLHPDLAVLLSTSGSTGSPKLVRLSHDNLRSNAASIASYLGITPDDRAMTSLPMHYCYGLSVVHSHLLTGAGLILTDDSVVEPRFWDLARDRGATSFAGVPYTFELLDQGGFADLDLPKLRYVTQAGGRMSPEAVTRYADLGRSRGWDFYVMYGQTEATARMAYLPPDFASTQPSAIGIPIPGGSIRLEPTADCTEPDSGELVYTGPNVMMGYATTPADLRLGATLSELRTGDLARRNADGLLEIVGRRSRFAKVFGIRIDLDGLERHLDDSGISGSCVSGADTVWVFLTRRRHSATARSTLAELCGLPEHAIQTVCLDTIPTTPSGKTDYASLQRHAEMLSKCQKPGRARLRRAGSAGELRDLYAEILGRPDASEDSSFVTLGGDSLSYVELSVRLGDLIESLPRDWHERTIGELATTRATRVQRGSTVETSVLIRALAIVLIVGTHANLLYWYGGAHILLGVAGYNFARFQLGAEPRMARLRRVGTTVARIAAPAMAFIAVVAWTTGMYEEKTIFFLNGVFGSNSWTDQWQFWFLEALIWTLLLVAAVLAIPKVDKAERRSPFGFAVVVLAIALTIRYVSVGVEAGPTERYMPTLVFWCFALGWAGAKASVGWQRALVSVAIVASTYGFFDDLHREATIAVGLLVLLWLPSIRVPRWVVVALGILASSSLYVYVVHWQVYPHWEVDHPLFAVLASFAVGIAYWKLVTIASRMLSTWSAHRFRITVPKGPHRYSSTADASP